MMPKHDGTMTLSTETISFLEIGLDVYKDELNLNRSEFGPGDKLDYRVANRVKFRTCSFDRLKACNVISMKSIKLARRDARPSENQA